ncbi:MAG: acyl-CoA reductase-like NAD-dependent aldehyde dehydrogenase [Mariniblastus sp.]|jgi:acyl-CoA reductase-like NAD-dependent aldehyde dehydrogenase
MAKSNRDDSQDRLEVLKTYKIYIGGKFPRTESGRYYSPKIDGKSLGNICLASRKDVRNAVVAARGAQPSWWAKTACNRGQILYRIAEMLEGRAEQFVSELTSQGLSAEAAKTEVVQSIDRLIYYAGWCDKYQQIFSAVNPVASSHFNFSVLEPTGVVFAVASEESPLLGLISLLAPIIAGGNSCVVLASESKPLSAITLSEVLATSDVPGGVVNLLTGSKSELVEHFSRHLDVNAIALDSNDQGMLTAIQEFAVENVKRVKQYSKDWSSEDSESPYLIHDFCEVKTTWHPIEAISATGSGY